MLRTMFSAGFLSGCARSLQKFVLFLPLVAVLAVPCDRSFGQASAVAEPEVGESSDSAVAGEAGQQPAEKPAGKSAEKPARKK